MSNVGPWEEFHFMWPSAMVRHLRTILPEGYSSGPQAHMGTRVAIDAGAYEENVLSSGGYMADDDGGGVTTAVWAPPAPSVAVEVELPDYDEYAVRIYDERTTANSSPRSRLSVRGIKTGRRADPTSSPSARPSSGRVSRSASWTWSRRNTSTCMPN
jgi:hypothetical protein